MGALAVIDGLNPAQFSAGLLWPLTRLMLFITIGLFVGQIIEVSGWIKPMALLARPLFRFGRLGNRCSAAFTAVSYTHLTLPTNREV